MVELKVIRTILSKYFQITDTETSISFKCPFCKKDGKDKEIYVYRDTGRIICYRCRLNKRTWHNAWVFLKDVLGAIGVNGEKILSEHKSIVYQDLGTPVIAGLGKYPQREFIPGSEELRISEYLKGRGYNVEKVLQFFWYGTKGELRDRICVPLQPAGWQGRVLTKEGNPKYKTIRGRATDNNLYFTPCEGLVSDSLFLVESPFGAVRLFEHDYDAVAFLGTNPGKPINALLRRKRVQDVYLWLDPDVPKERLLEISKHFISEDYVLYIIQYHKEPDDCNKEEIQEALAMATEFCLDEVY
jgi:hypothetical protein